MKRVFAGVVAAMGLAACGGSTQPSGPQQFEQAQKPVSPKSVFAGRIIDAATQQPLDGVSVKALGVDTSIPPTGADGTFRLDSVVAGSTVTFVFEKMGYVRRVETFSTPAAAGNSPLEGGVRSFSQRLFPATCSVGGFVFLPNGRPASGATVLVDQSGSYGESVVTAQTSMDGAFLLSGLACLPGGASHTVSAAWYDENGDAQADYGSVSQSVTLYPGQAARIFLNYSAGSVGNRIVASNISDGEVPSGEDLQFTLALPVLPLTLDQNARNQALLVNVTRGSNEVPTEVTFMSPTQLRVKPANASLRDGERYALTLNLRNANANTGSGNITTNFSQTLNFQVRPAVVMPFTVVVSGVQVQNDAPTAPFGLDRFNFDSTSFRLSWTTTSEAVRYEVFARDRVNPNYLFLQSVDAAPTPRQQQVVNLTAAAFDAAPGLAGIQPLAYGNTLTFAVVAVDVFGNRSPLMMASPVTVRDDIPPTVSSGPVLVDDFSGVGALDAINETAAPVAYRVRMRYSEPMDVSPAGAPTFTSTATNAPTATWSWDPTDATQRTAILTLTIPPNGDSTGAFLIRGGRDSSSVAVAQAGDVVGVLGGRRELLQNGNFQVGSACSLANWTPETTMSAPPPVAISNNGAIAGATSPCAAVLGSVPGTPPTTGRARLFQDVTVPSTMMTGFTLTASARTRGVFVASRVTPGASYAMQCRVETTATPPVSQGSLGGHSGSGSTDAVQAAYQASNIASIAQSSVTLRVLCESDNATTFAGTGAFYVDEVSLALVRPGTL